MAEFKFAPPYELPVYPFTPPPELQGGQAQRYPIVIVGAGPAGLTLACDLAQRGVRSVLIDDDETVLRLGDDIGLLLVETRVEDSEQFRCLACASRLVKLRQSRGVRKIDHPVALGHKKGCELFGFFD